MLATLLIPLLLAAPAAGPTPTTDRAAIAPSVAATPVSTEIDLRRSARIAPGEPIHLRDIAAISGPLAETLGAIVIADSPDRLEATSPPSPWRRVTPARVTAAIEAVEGVNLGRVRLRGDAVLVTKATQRRASKSGGIDTDAAPDLAARGGTVHAHALAFLREILDVRREDLRVRFDAKDAELLATSTPGRTVELRPIATSARMPLAVTVYERDRIVAAGTLSAHVRVRREAAVPSTPINPDDAIGAANATRQTLWLAPDVRPAAPDEVFGSLARSRLAPGRPIEVEDIESPLTIRRGDRVQIHAVARGVVVRMPGRAKTDARMGETIEVEVLGRDRTLTCRAQGEGRVVALVESVDPKTSAAKARSKAHASQGDQE